MSKAIQFIQAVARKLLSKRGKGIASIGNRMQVEAKAGEIAETFRLSGLPLQKLDEFIKSEKDVTKYLNLIEEATKPKITKTAQPKPLMQSKSGDVIDFPPERITDWTKERPGRADLPEIPKKADSALYEDRGGNIIPAQFKDVAKETDEQILNKLNKGNKESVERLKNKPLDPDDALPNYKKTPGNYSERKTPGSIENLREEIKIAYRKEFDRLRGDETAEELTDMLKNLDTDGVPFAEGGPTSTGLNYLLGEDDTNSRVSYATGGRRGFLKILAGLGAAGAAFKTGLLGLGKGATKKVVTEVAKEAATGGAPPHFLKLIAKIKALGDDVTETAATADRQKVTKYKDFELTEDVVTGRQEIQRTGRQSDDAFVNEQASEDVFMSYTPGETIIGKNKKPIKATDEYTEFTSYISNNRGNTGEILEEVSGVPDDIFKEVGEAIPEAIRKGKAEGGRMGYAGGKKVVQGLISLLNKKAGKNVLTTADKLPIPKKTIDRDMFRQANNRLNLKKQMTDEDYEDFLEYDLSGSDIEGYNFDGTYGDAQRILKEKKAYEADMYNQYKMGKLDPEPGDQSQARKRFLEKKFEDMEGSGDKRLMTRDEVEELSTFDLGTEMDNYKKTDDVDLTQGMIDLDELNFTKNAQAAKKKIDEMQTLNMSPEQKLRDEFPGIEDRLIRNILTDKNPQRIAEVKQTMREALKMQEKGMSVDEIIELFKKSPRTKQAEGGRMGLWLGGGLTAGKGLTRELLKRMTTGSSHGRSPADILKRVNPKQFEKFLNDPSLPFKFSSDTGIMGSDMVKDLIKKTKTDRQYVLEQLLNTARNIKKGDDNLLTYKNQIIKEMVSTGMDRKTAKDFTETLSESLLKEVGSKKGFPKVTEQGLIELENIQKNLLTKDRQLNSSGGLARMLGE